MNRNLVVCVCLSLPLFLLDLSPAVAQNVTLTPSTLAFTAQGVGTTGAAQTVTVKNTSASKTLSITSIAASGEFPNTTTCGSSLGPGATCMIGVTFSPSTVGATDGAVTLVDNATPGTQVVSLTGLGVAPVTLAPATLTFPSTAIGKTSKPLKVTLTNSPTALTMSTVTASGDYAISTNTCTGTIAPNKTCTISVTFAPTVSGAILGALTVNDSASGDPQVVSLTGTGTGTVKNPVSLSPSSLTFASQSIGTTSVGQVATLTNKGTTSLKIASVTASGDYAEKDTCAGKTIQAGKTCSITVTFAPSASGTISGAITIADTATTKTQELALTGTGVRPLSFSPGSLAFAGQVGVTGNPQSATLTNNSSNSVTISKIAVSGEYTETNTCGGSLAANTSCTFSVKFVPFVAGTIDGAVSVTIGGSNAPQVLNLTGTSSTGLVGRYAYALEYSALTPGLVVAYAMNPETGALRTLETVQLPSNNYGIVVHPSNKFVYMPDGAQILAYGIDSNGLLQPLSGSPFKLPGGSALKFTANGKFAYTNSGVEYTVNLITGALTEVGTATLGNLPFDVAIAPGDNFVYIPNFTDATISGFVVNQTTGVLTAIGGSPFADGDSGPAAAVVSPNGKYLLVANYGANNAGSISVFTLNPTTGALTAIAGSPFSGSGPGNGIAVDPSGKFLYVASSGIDAYSINQNTGALTAVSGSPYTIPATAYGVTVDPTGRFLYASIFGNLSTGQTAPDVITYSINPSNGGLTQIGSQGVDGNQGEALAISTGSTAVAYTPKFAYTTNQGSLNISEYTVNDTTGALTQLRGSPLSDSNGPQVIAATPSGAFVYTGNANNSISEYKVNAKGALILVSGSPITGFGSVNALAVDPAGGFLLGLDATNKVLDSYTINPTTGALTFLDSSPTPSASSQSVTLDPTGTVAILTTLTAVDFYAVNNGALSPLKAGSGTGLPIAVATDQSSQYALVAEHTLNSVVTYALPFGGIVSTAATGNNPRAVVAEPSGKYVYVANSGDGTISAYSLNLATGGLTQIGSAFQSAAGTDSLITSNDGKYLYAANNTAGTISSFKINSDGTLTSAGSANTGTAPTSIVTTGTIQ